MESRKAKEHPEPPPGAEAPAPPRSPCLDTQHSLGLRNRVRTGPWMPVVLSLKPVLKCPPQAGLKGFTEEMMGQPPSSTHTRGGRGFKLRRPEGREGDRKGQKEEASETTYLQNTIRDHAYGVDGGCLLFFVLKFPVPRETLLQQPLQALQASPLSAPLCGRVLPCRAPHFTANFTPPRRFNEQPRVSSQRGPLPAHPQNMPS